MDFKDLLAPNWGYLTRWMYKKNMADKEKMKYLGCSKILNRLFVMKQNIRDFSIYFRQRFNFCQSLSHFKSHSFRQKCFFVKEPILAPFFMKIKWKALNFLLFFSTILSFLNLTQIMLARSISARTHISRVLHAFETFLLLFSYHFFWIDSIF